MRFPFLLLLILFTATITSCTQNLYKKKYEIKLEKDSRLIQFGYNYTFEKLRDKSFVYKRYYPENKMITHLYTYSDRNLTTLQGLCMEGYDDGTVVDKGNYVSNSKEGEWIENIYYHGSYKNNAREGEWKRFDANNFLRETINYSNGELHGIRTFYDTLGIVKNESEYNMGELIHTTGIGSDVMIVETSPRFPGCEDYGLEGEQLDACATKKMLEFIYGNLKYPKFAVVQEIQGQAIVTFVVDKQGNVTDVQVRRGVCKEIKKEVQSLVKSMPKWYPGYQDGRAVKVFYTLPIKFQLEG